MKRLLPKLWTFILMSVITAAGIIVITKNNSTLPKDSPSPKTTDNQSKTTNPMSIEYGLVPGNALASPNQKQRAATLKIIKDAGFSDLRFGLDWSQIESVQGKYNWTATDQLMRVVKSSGLHTILRLDRTPVWARPANCKANIYCAPSSAEAFGAFAAAAAARYKDDNISAWEIWNEENSVNFWKPLPNAAQYATLLSAASKAIKQQDSNAVVLVGGLSGDSVDKLGPTLIDPRTYLTQLYATNAQADFDGIGYHPYISGFGLPSKQSDYNGWAKMDTGDNSIRSIMTLHGDADKGIWITEFGVPTGGRGIAVTDASQPTPKGADHVTLDAQVQITQAVVGSVQQSPWIRSFVWYSYRDDTTAATNSGAAYGIWTIDGKPKPALRILQQAMRQTKNNT